MRKLKVLIGDDSIVYRALLKKILRTFPWIEISGSAADGEKVLLSIRQNTPDVVILDVEMPVMDGMAVMAELSRAAQRPQVIMCSSFTTAGAAVTIQALALGAYDFITKPEGQDRYESEEKLKRQLEPLLESLLKSKIDKESTQEILIESKLPKSLNQNVKPSLVCIGISTGGPNALMKVLPDLPSTFTIPIVIVQHMPPLFIDSLAASLNKKCALNVKVAEEGEQLQAGVIYFAPGQRQMGIIGKGSKIYASLVDAPAENHCKPAADFLFRSASEVLKKKVLGIVMTGMGGDGAKGLKLLYDAGALTMAQDQSSSTIYGMPKEAVRLGGTQIVVSLEDIAQKIIAAV